MGCWNQSWPLEVRPHLHFFRPQVKQISHTDELGPGGFTFPNGHYQGPNNMLFIRGTVLSLLPCLLHSTSKKSLLNLYLHSGQSLPITVAVPKRLQPPHLLCPCHLLFPRYFSLATHLTWYSLSPQPTLADY